MNAYTEADASRAMSWSARVSLWGAFRGILAFGLYQVVADFAWLVLVAVAVAGFWR